MPALFNDSALWCGLPAGVRPRAQFISGRRKDRRSSCQFFSKVAQAFSALAELLFVIIVAHFSSSLIRHFIRHARAGGHPDQALGSTDPTFWIRFRGNDGLEDDPREIRHRNYESEHLATLLRPAALLLLRDPGA